MARGLVSPAEQMAHDEEWIASGLVNVEKAKLLLANQNEEEAKRTLGRIGFTYGRLIQAAHSRSWGIL